MEKYKVVYKKRFQQKFLRLLNYLNTEWGIKVTDDFIATFEGRITTCFKPQYWQTIKRIGSEKHPHYKTQQALLQVKKQ